jgi:hypothetical protein
MTIVISTIERPHVESAECWCRPVEVHCECDQNHDSVWGHRFVEARPDSQPRMAIFSEQIPWHVPSWGR